MSRKKVVVIDDSAFMLEIANHIITEAGFTVVTAKTCIEANTHIFTAPFPVMVLIDVEMPMLRGDKTTSLLKGILGSQSLPILLMSHKTDEQMLALCKESGADGYIIKPLTTGKFKSAVKQYCSS